MKMTYGGVTDGDRTVNRSSYNIDNFHYGDSVYVSLDRGERPQTGNIGCLQQAAGAGFGFYQQIYNTGD